MRGYHARNPPMTLNVSKMRKDKHFPLSHSEAEVILSLFPLYVETCANKDAIKATAEFKIISNLRWLAFFCRRHTFTLGELREAVGCWETAFNKRLELTFVPRRQRDHEDQVYDPPIIPKEHYLTHLSRDVEMHGPPLQGFSTNRFEAKHQDLKKIVHHGRTRINLLAFVTVEMEKKAAFINRTTSYMDATVHYKNGKDNLPVIELENFPNAPFRPLSYVAVNHHPFRKGWFFQISARRCVKITLLVCNANEKVGFAGPPCTIERDPFFVETVVQDDSNALLLVLVEPFKFTVINDRGVAKVSQFLDPPRFSYFQGLGGREVLAT